jgi:hypothetical protein
MCASGYKPTGFIEQARLGASKAAVAESLDAHSIQQIEIQIA